MAPQICHATQARPHSRLSTLNNVYRAPPRRQKHSPSSLKKVHLVVLLAPPPHYRPAAPHRSLSARTRSITAPPLLTEQPASGGVRGRPQSQLCGLPTRPPLPYWDKQGYANHECRKSTFHKCAEC